MRAHHHAVLITAAILLPGLATAGAASPGRHRAAVPLVARATAEGSGGAVATVDPTATAAAIDVLRAGGNAVDASVAAAATLGVTEPFSAGVGGGGFLLHYDARTGTVHTIDGREAAPAAMGPDAFVDPSSGKPFGFDQARVSGLSVGVPGTLAMLEGARRRWGSRPLAALLEPAIRAAGAGFIVDRTFRDQVAENAAIFGRFSSSAALYLPGGRPPAVGTIHRNPDLAGTYQLIARHGVDAFYRGPVAADIVATVAHPPVAPDPIGSWPHPILPGSMAAADLAGYRVRTPEPSHSRYRGLDVYGMATPSSGGIAVSEALNILEQVDLGVAPRDEALHRYLEAGALAFADRNRYVGDGIPRALLDELVSDGFAAERACLIHPDRALPKPVAPGLPDGAYGGCSVASAAAAVSDHEQHTTNLAVADRWGNVVELTFTIEQIGGSGIVVPGRGFLLNNELTDFNFTPSQGAAPDPNLPAPGKRPRSSMSPTIVVSQGRPFLALGSPGGSTIITTVLQTLVNRIDLGMTLPEAIAAPRATPRNSSPVLAEPAFLTGPESDALRARGHVLAGTSEIGSATAIEVLPGGRLLAAAEPVRRGGGAAATVW